MQLNEEQKKAAFCNENAVVAAGAGSGKTMVLANRYVWLLTEKGCKVDEILTLTFTKKAAAQMYKRIYSLVSEIAVTETGAKAERARRALDDFFHARIQTLDSYSASIVKQSAVRYGLSPDYKIDQERCFQIALDISYPYFIGNRHHPAIEMLYNNHRPRDIVHNIFANILFNYSKIDKSINYITDVKTQFDILCLQWNDLCKELIALLKETENLIFDNQAFLPDLVPIMDNFSKQKTVIPQALCLREYLDFLLTLPPDDCIEKAQSHPLQKSFVMFLFFWINLIHII